MLNNATTDADKACLLACQSAGTGDWLCALPLSNIGLRIDDASLRVAVGLRLGAPLVHAHKCICGVEVDREGRHGLSCKMSAGRLSRHNHINDVLQKGLRSAGVTAVREPAGLLRTDGKKPDGITLTPWRRGHCLVWDATCSDTFAPSHIVHTSAVAGSAAEAADSKKRTKYNNLCALYEFVPVAVETMGFFVDQGRSLW